MPLSPMIATCSPRFKAKERLSNSFSEDVYKRQVTSLSVSGDHRLNFAKEEDKWVNTDDREMPLNQTLVSSLVNNIAGITTESVVEQPEDLSEYGLDNPVRTIKATLENGSSIIIYVGNQNDLTGDYYIRLEGDDRVYGCLLYTSRCV